MKKFILIGLVIVLSKLSFVYADDQKLNGSEQLKKIYDSRGTFTSWFSPSPVTITNKYKLTINKLKDLAGKTIYRDVPARNVEEFSKEYMNEPYELFSYNESIMELKDANKKSIILDRDLWDDGNWKEYVETTWRREAGSETFKIRFDFKFGDKVRTTDEYNENFHVPYPGIVGKITNITTVLFPSNEVATLDSGERLGTYWLQKYDTKITKTWYIGQEVWDVIKGRGRVVNIILSETSDWKVRVKFDNDLFCGWSDMDDYTLSGKYNDRQAQRLFPIETKSVVYNLDKLFPKK